ncbi:MAG: TIR domain-containing protein [Bacteroidota bacterium]|nr:TIR domain-containing protein [Bacteroidota bacterium]MDP4235810.1 TIR domain-containing protein [Bacteroidota bacterium]
MSDIFISYSSKDKDKADQLSELLASAGLSVWVDQQNIHAASSWSEEIVKAIDDCHTLIVMLSPSSVASHNVIKEVSLASEKRKKILPLDLEPVELPQSMQYALAGIQRAPMTNIDAIIRALGKLGLEATQAPTLKLVKETDARKSLMILPFEDMSPTGDNGWFADGLGAELISALSNVKSLRVSDQQATKDYKRYQGTLPNYAKEMSIRYFIQGSVRKFGDQIKITSSLLDIESGDHLWQDSMKGTMDDIFDIQETVAQKVVEGLKVHLASDEKKKLAEHGTENAMAYELYMKAYEYSAHSTKEGFQLAVQLISEAIKLDTKYALAYNFKATMLVALYRGYDRAAALLDEAEILCKDALRLEPDLFDAYYPLSLIYAFRGQIDAAEEASKEFVRKDPQNYYSHFALGFFYMETSQPAKAIAPFEEAVRLKPGNIACLINLVTNCDAAAESAKCRHWASAALPHIERYLTFNPDDETMQVWHATLLFHCDRRDEAHAAAMKLTNLKDGSTLYGAAYLFASLGDYSQALRTFRKSIEAGFKSIRHLKEFLTDENAGVLALADTEEFEAVKRMVEELESKM